MNKLGTDIISAFYVYFLIDSRNAEIFYVGRGQGKRAWVHLRPSMLKENSPKNDRIKDIIQGDGTVEILIRYDNLSFEESIYLEKIEIENIGKANLTNRTSGGQGLGSGTKAFLGRTHSLATRKILSEAKAGEKNPMYGDKWHRSYTGKVSFKEKMSGIHHHLFGNHHTLETKNKISSKLKDRKLTDAQKKQRKLSMMAVWEKRKKGIMPMPSSHKKLDN